MDDKCRLCLQKLQPEEGTPLDDSEFGRKVESVFPFTLENAVTLPRAACGECVTIVSDFFTYSRQVQENQQHFVTDPFATVISEPYELVLHKDDADFGSASEREESNPLSDLPRAASDDESSATSADSGKERKQANHRKSRRKPRAVKKATDGASAEIAQFYKFVCDICAVKTNGIRELRDHFKKCHGTTPAYMQCCKKVPLQRGKLLEHMSMHQGTLRCTVCQKSYCSRKYLVQHQLLCHNPTRHTPWQCSVCGKTLSSNQALRIHKEHMHGQGRNSICPTCGKLFRTKLGLERHIKQHLGIEAVQKFQCQLCKKWISGKPNLKLHMKFIHQQHGQIFRCDLCHREHPNELALQRHRKRVHVEQRFECEICGKRFKHKVPLREHLATHTAEPLYSCDICGVTFNSKANRYVHRKVKHRSEWEAGRAGMAVGGNVGK